MTQIAYIFPGQGSQSVGMMSSWGDHTTSVNSLFQQASDILELDLLSIVKEGPKEQLNQTHITQPAMLVSGVASFQVWQKETDFNVDIMAGHSLGEYTALVCAGKLAFADAVKLVHKRGQLMQQAVAEGEGAMAAIIGLADEDVVKACAQVSEGVVSAVNFNSPGQVVIAGNKASVEQAMVFAKEAGAKRALPLPVSVPSHCSLMEPAADALFQTMQDIEIESTDIRVIQNESADFSDDEKAIKSSLRKQLSQPVRWVESVQKMQQQGVTHLIEMGPGKVLAGLTKRIDKSLKALPVYDSESLEQAKTTLAEDL
ncbi:MAG: ACP S-malonyltransferase [Gammaproteobacteria bacterium]|nr:ACP S-malonyltransferase [Gammaproteobacteria bacterium]